MKQFSCEIISCLRRMIYCSCHTPTIAYIMKKSPNDKSKGAQHTPGRGVVGTLRLVDSLKPYAPDSVGWMMHHVAAEKGGIQR